MRRISGPIIALVTLAAISLGLPGPAQAGTHPPTRNGFMIGFGVGGASLGLQDAGSREGSVTANFRIGYAVRQDLVLHYEGNGWAKTVSTTFGQSGDAISFSDVIWTFSTSTAALTYYPANTGIFLRGGIGIGSAHVQVETGGLKVSHDESGFGFILAGGYEGRLSKKFALAPQVEYSYQDLDTFKSSDMVGGSLGFNWYW